MCVRVDNAVMLDEQIRGAGTEVGNLGRREADSAGNVRFVVVLTRVLDRMRFPMCKPKSPLQMPSVTSVSLQWRWRGEVSGGDAVR